MAKKEKQHEQAATELQKDEAPPHPAEEAPKTTAVARAQPSNEVVERLRDALESLESFHKVGFPMIRFKEAFTMAEGADEIEEFEGVIIYTKEMNAYYKERYKPGSRALPDCFSPDGKKPTTAKPVHTDCATCPMNQFGSAKEGDGKACKNVRPLYILVQNQESGDLAIIPKQLRVPPTSLTLIRSYIMSVAADFGAYFAVRTKFSVFKKSDAQTHYNIKFSLGKRLTAEERANVAYIRHGWMPQMMEATVTEPVEEEAHAPAAPTVDVDAEGGPRF